MNHLLVLFAISSVLVLICVAIHGIGLFTLSIVIAMLALHGFEIWAFAFMYMLIGAVPGIEDALYFSTISYSTVGYNDTHILAEWRLLGAFESILGMLLLGWSTAFFFRMLGRIDAH